MSTVARRTLQSSSDDAILLTGATGFVGMAVLVRLLERTERRVLALVRARTQDEADARLDSLMRSLFDDPERYAQRIEAVRGDLTSPWLGLDPSARERIGVEVEAHLGAIPAGVLGTGRHAVTVPP